MKAWIKTLVLIVLFPLFLTGCAAVSADSGARDASSGGPPIDSDWNQNVVQSKESAIAYLRSHPGTRYSQELFSSLKPYATPSMDMTVDGGFVEYLKHGNTSGAVCYITQINENMVNLGGAYDEIPSTTAARPQGGIVSNNWGSGARHTILTSLNIFGYCIVSDHNHPLVFNIVSSKGYEYVRGVGVIVDPTGNVVLLGYGGPVDVAAAQGKADELRKLLASDPQLVNERDKDGETPLHWAAIGGSKAAAEVLLAAKANLEAVDNDQCTPLHKATFFGSTDVASLLIARGANVNARDNMGCGPLHNAAFRGHAEIIRLLLSKGAEVNAKDKAGKTALHMAAFDSSTTAVEILLSASADVNAADDDGYTPLHVSAFKNAADVAELLLKWKANVNAVSHDGTTPLGMARAKNADAVADLLIRHGGH